MSGYEEQIRRTGFPLEYAVGSKFKRAGWSLISNKYYLDDHQEVVREIDLIAYKARDVGPFRVYTTVVVSCKKSETTAWALFARGAEHSDPNTNWRPAHVWSNHKVVRHLTDQVGWSNKYHETLERLGCGQAWALPRYDVFAYQELAKDPVQGPTSNQALPGNSRGRAGNRNPQRAQHNNKPQNDRPIYQAVTSLMKAQAYELDRLPERRKDHVVYQFNLLSVVDADLVRVDFSDAGFSIAAIEDEHYVARYIIKRKETFSRIRFCTAGKVDSIIAEYDKLHEANCSVFAEHFEGYFSQVQSDRTRLNVLKDDAWAKLDWRLNWELRRGIPDAKPLGAMDLQWAASDECLNVTFDVEREVVDFLNNSSVCRRVAEKALEEVYRYRGKVAFDCDIPF